jgi:hypothetical protein
MKNKILGLLGCLALVACEDSVDDTTGPVIEEKKASIVINEFISRNKNDNDNQMRSFLDEEGKYSDWIELKNNGDLDVNLFDYYLSDDPDSLFVYNMRDTIIAPGEYYTLFANISAVPDAVLENTAPFKLSFSCGDELYLVKKSDSSVVDSVLFHYGSLNYDYLVSNRSFGRNNENQWVPQEKVTPNLNNQSENGSLESMTKTDESGRYDPVKCEA